MLKSIVPLIISTITIVCFQNCAPLFDVKNVSHRSNLVSDPTFASYVEDFEGRNNNTKVEVPIVFKDLDPKYAGICYRTFTEKGLVGDRIEIDIKNWKSMSEYQRINLIFHELGHCVLNRDHVVSSSVLLCPTSFMDPTVMSTSCIEQHYEDYMKEMFP